AIKTRSLRVAGCLIVEECPGPNTCQFAELNQWGLAPADTGKQARKRSVATDGAGIPLGLAAAGANPPRLPLPAPTCRPRSPRWAPCLTRSSPILIAAYDSVGTRALLEVFGLQGEIARKAWPPPVQAGKRWVVKRTHA